MPDFEILSRFFFIRAFVAIFFLASNARMLFAFVFNDKFDNLFYIHILKSANKYSFFIRAFVAIFNFYLPKKQNFRLSQ